MIARDDTPPARRPVLVIDRLLPGLLVAGGHRLRVIEMATELDLELPADAGRRPFRLRARMLPAIGPVTHMHLRGLNCFLVRGQQPPTGGLDFSSSDSVRLLTSDRRSSLSIEVALGVRDGDRWRLMLPGTQLTLPVDQATDLAIITSASVDELVLIHRNQE